jgi:hypothetical protein
MTVGIKVSHPAFGVGTVTAERVTEWRRIPAVQIKRWDALKLAGVAITVGPKSRPQHRERRLARS